MTGYDLTQDELADQHASMEFEDYRRLRAENERLRAALTRYKNCRHACIDCFCTKEARAALEGENDG